jgi:hypothetical protein
LLRSFADAVRHFKKIPTTAELRMFGKNNPDFPSHSTFTNNFRAKGEFLGKLREWIAKEDEYADIAALIPEEVQKQAKLAPTKEGFVYLIKSGAHYKIGRSDELERRVKEIRIALPEAATLVHSIRTDDPAGIEAYWHRRFADRQANGEWFKLSNTDVAAFKRRKFQ